MESVKAMRARLGQPLPPTRWFEISQAVIDAHAETHQDWQFIHVDPKRAQAAGLDSTIAHGFLTLSMLSGMAYDTDIELAGAQMGYNYGFNKLRFLAPVPAGTRIRGVFTPQKLEEKRPGEVLLVTDVLVEIEHQDRPALAAEWLNLYIFNMEEA